VPRWLVYGAATIVVFLLAVVALAYLFQRRLVYLPTRGPVPPAARVLAGAGDVRLTAADGVTLGAWFVPASAGELGFTVLVANGNGGNRADRAELASALRDAGFDVLLFDYRGYGDSAGDPSEAGLALDVRAARSYLVDDLGVPPSRLVYFGESIGGGVVTELAVSHPPAGMVLRSPFTRLADTAAEHYPFLPVRLLLRDRYPVVDHVRRIRVPTVVVYGSADSIVPPAQSRAVAEAAAGPVTVVEIRGADHNDPVLLSGSRVVGAVAGLVS
jgi:uncharacterized protein